MKLQNIFKSFTKAQTQLNTFINQNGEEIGKLRKELDAKHQEQQKALTVRDNIKTLLGEAK